MKFVCGHCGGTIREGNYSKHHASFVPHEECGFETYFATFIPSPQKPDPTPGEVRPMNPEAQGDGDPGGPIGEAIESPEKKAVAYVMSHGYSEEAAVKIVAEHGAEEILVGAKAASGGEVGIATEVEDASETKIAEESDDAADAVKQVEQSGEPESPESNIATETAAEPNAEVNDAQPAEEPAAADGDKKRRGRK